MAQWKGQKGSEAKSRGLGPSHKEHICYILYGPVGSIKEGSVGPEAEFAGATPDKGCIITIYSKKHT